MGNVQRTLSTIGKGYGTVAHVAVFAPPAGGHINPTLGVISELCGSGHRVSFVSTREYASRIVETGAELVAYRSYFAPSKPDELIGDELTRGLLEGLRETQALVPKLTPWFRRERPDLVLFDGSTAWWGRLLAEQHDVRSIAYWPTFVSNDRWRFTDAYIRPNKLDPRMLVFAARLSRLAGRFGLRFSDLLNGVGPNVRAQLVFLARSFQFEHESFDEEFHFVGPCLGKRDFQGEWTPPPDDRPLCLVQLGTQREPTLLAKVVKAFEGSPWRVVLAIGAGLNPASLGTLPDGVEVHRTVPQLQVLQRAHMFITQAGTGSVMEALRFEVPMIALPHVAEQRANADRLAELKLGRQLDPELFSSNELRETIRSVSVDDRIRQNIGTIRREMTETGGTARAVRVIEEALAEHPT